MTAAFTHGGGDPPESTDLPCSVLLFLAPAVCPRVRPHLVSLGSKPSLTGRVSRSLS